jgi:hypothetical protein
VSCGKAARNEHIAIDEGITYVSGVKHGAKRLRHAANAVKLDERERTVPAFGTPTFGARPEGRRALSSQEGASGGSPDGWGHVNGWLKANGIAAVAPAQEPPAETPGQALLRKKQEMWKRRHAEDSGATQTMAAKQQRKAAERAAMGAEGPEAREERMALAADEKEEGESADERRARKQAEKEEVKR